MTIEQLTAKLAEIDAQIEKVIETDYANGYNQLQALRTKAGELEQAIRELNHQARVAKVNELTKGLKMSKGQRELLDSIIFWGNQGRTITVDGRSLKNLETLQKVGLIKIVAKRSKWSAELLD